MSKSYRRPFSCCHGHNSAKKDKKTAHRGLRRLQNHSIKLEQDFDEYLVPLKFEAPHNDTWGWYAEDKGHFYPQRITNRDLTELGLGDPTWVERKMEWIEECKRK